MRKIVDLKNVDTQELVYPATHSDAVLMPDGKAVTEVVIRSVQVDNVSKTPADGVVDLGYLNKELIVTSSDSMSLSPNVYYRNTNASLSSLTITLNDVENSSIINEYFVEFTTSSSGTTISLPSSIKWFNGKTPTFDSGATYQISIVNDLGTCLKFV